MSTFTQLKDNVRVNLNDSGITFWDATDIDESFVDAYNDIFFRTQCRIKKTTLSWVANALYLDLAAAPYSVTDWMATTAIFNNVNNRWLDDNLPLKSLDNIRDDWELATGSPGWWCPSGGKYTVIFPHYAIASGTFDLYYWATPEAIVGGSTPNLVADMQNLLEHYSTADLLEQAEKYSAASFHWEKYFLQLQNYSERVKKIAKSDLATIF